MNGVWIGKFAVVLVDYGDTCDEFPDVLGVYDTPEDAAQEMLADIHELREAHGEGYCESKCTATHGELWYDSDKTSGCRWKVVEI